MSRHKKHRIKTKSMYQWHRYIGISASLFVLILSISGLLLNHTDEFSLAEHHISNSLILDHYGIKAPDNITSFQAGKHWISQWDNRLFLNQTHIDNTYEPLVGAMQYRDMIIVALNSSLWLYTAKGELIEKLSGNEGVPAGISAIGLTDTQKVAVMASHGVYSADADLIIWQDNPTAITVWSDAIALPEKMYQRLLPLYRGSGLSFERVLLDLHSGRLFNQGGVYFMDFIALLLIFLACSGLWLWSIRKLRGHTKKKQR